MNGDRIATPAVFAHHASGGRFKIRPHIRLVDDYLVQASHQPLRVMIWEPPRHGKSEHVSRYFPAWYEGMFRNRRFMLLSYEADFAAGWGGKARDLLDEHGDWFGGISVRTDSEAKNRWDIEGSEGGMVALGMGGAITGRGAHMLVIDDPIKNPKQVMSERFRDDQWEWYQGVARPRLEPGASIVVMQTRWHEDDLSGRILANPVPGEDWIVVRLPALAEENDVLGREVGEALWPGRWPLEVLEKTRSAIGSYFWAAQYQQRPAPLAGAIFKRHHFQHYHAEADHFRLGERLVARSACRLFATADTAATAKTSSDYTVVAIWAVTPDTQLVLVDLLRVQEEGPEQRELLVRAWERWRPAWIGIEEKMTGIALLQDMRRLGVMVRALKADADKVTRALSAAAMYEAGSIWHPAQAPWLDEFEGELLAFPHAAHDDQVDVVGYAARNLVRQPARAGVARVRIPGVA